MSRLCLNDCHDGYYCHLTRGNLVPLVKIGYRLKQNRYRPEKIDTQRKKKERSHNNHSAIEREMHDTTMSEWLSRWILSFCPGNLVALVKIRYPSRKMSNWLKQNSHPTRKIEKTQQSLDIERDSYVSAMLNDCRDGCYHLIRENLVAMVK